MFLKLIFIVWIIQSYNLWKRKIENLTFEELYGNKEQKRRNVGKPRKEVINYEEYKESETLQDTILKDFTLELRNLLKEKAENILKVREFFEKDEEDSLEWIKEFNRIADANNWKESKRIIITAAHLREIAAEWYDQDQENIQRWFKEGNNDSFEERFVGKFTTEIERSEWIRKLTEFKQKRKEIV